MKLSEEQKGNTKIFTIEGRLDSNTTPSFEEKIYSAIEEGKLYFILDLKNLDYISSTGVRAFIQLHKKLQKEKGILIFLAIPKKIQHILQITGFLPLFTMVETMPEALELAKFK